MKSSSVTSPMKARLHKKVLTFRFCGVNHAYSESVTEVLGCHLLNEISAPEI